MNGALVRTRTVALASVILLSACASLEPAPASVAARPSSSPSATATQPARATPSATDLLASLLNQQVASWKPGGPSAIVTVARAQEATIVAVPLDGATPTPLLTIRDLSGSVPATVPVVARSDGAFLALALATGTTTRRIALLDLATGQARWLTTANANTSVGLSAWSVDGRSLYFGTIDPSGVPVISHVALDGSALPQIHPAVSFGRSLPSRGSQQTECSSDLTSSMVRRCGPWTCPPDRRFPSENGTRPFGRGGQRSRAVSCRR